MIQKNSERIVIISATAAEDLKDIWEYVAEHSENAANKLIKELSSKFILLRNSPLIGREQNSYLVGLRSFVAKDYFIFYLSSENGIEVLRILHSSRDVERIFEEFFDSISDNN